ncbi:hypothetical protein BaRGS_00017915, partial [Batillaria attramentaria]
AASVNGICQLADGSDLMNILRKSGASAVLLDPDLAWGPWPALKKHVQLGDGNTVTSDKLPDLRRVYFIRRHYPLHEWDQSETCSGSGENAKEQTTVEKHGEGMEQKATKPPDTDGLSSEFDAIGFTTKEDCEDFLAGLKHLNGWYAEEADSEDIAVVFTSSGSTGFSKLVTFKHGPIIGGATIMTKEEEYGTWRMQFTMAQMGWLGGYTFQQLCSGYCRVTLDDRADPPEDRAVLVWDAIVSEKCHTASVQPPVVKQIVRLKDRSPYKVNMLALAGQVVTRDLVLQGQQLCHVVLVLYGTTELSVVTARIVTDFDKYQDFDVGGPLPGAQVKVCDENGEEVPRGTKGEIYAKMPNMFSGYYNSPEETASAMTEDGFLRTSDVGLMLEDGNFCVEGRSQDIIMKGIYNIYPAWLETRIQRCPGVQDVLVVGVPDPIVEKEICACFVASDPAVSEDDVRAFVEKDIIEKDELKTTRPRYYLKFQSFPTTFTGKALRRVVREEATRRIQE